MCLLFFFYFYFFFFSNTPFYIPIPLLLPLFSFSLSPPLLPAVSSFIPPFFFLPLLLSKLLYSYLLFSSLLLFSPSLPFIFLSLLILITILTHSSTPSPCVTIKVFHSNHCPQILGARLKVVILSPNPPSEPVKLLLLLSQFVGKVSFFVGRYVRYKYVLII